VLSMPNAKKTRRLARLAGGLIPRPSGINSTSPNAPADLSTFSLGNQASKNRPLQELVDPNSTIKCRGWLATMVKNR